MYKLLLRTIQYCFVVLSAMVLVACLYSSNQQIGIGYTLGHFAFLAVMWMLLERIFPQNGVPASRREMLFLSVACFLTCWMVCEYLPVIGVRGQTADSSGALKCLLAGTPCRSHDTRYFYWATYEIFLSVLGVIFAPAMRTGQLANAFFAALAVMPVFRICERVGGRSIARFIVLMLISSPALLLWGSVLSSTIISAVFMLYAAYYFFEASDCGKIDRRFVLAAVLSGGALGFSYIFKSIIFIFNIALIVYVLLVVFRRPGWRVVMRASLLFLLVFSVSKYTGRCSTHVLAVVGNSPGLVEGKGHFVEDVLYELILGLNLHTRGCWYTPLAHEVVKLDSAGRWRKLKEVVKKDWRAYPKLLVDKFVGNNGTHCGPGSIGVRIRANSQANLVKRTGPYRCPLWAIYIMNGFQVGFALITLLAALGMCFIRGRDLSYFCPGIVSIVIIAEFTVMLMLIEGNSCYRVAIYPFHFLVLPYIKGWYEMWDRVRRSSVSSRLKEHLRPILAIWQKTLGVVS